MKTKRTHPLIYSINLIPAYGRDYTSPQAVITDWRDGLDFKIADISSPWDGRYTSIRDWAGHSVRIRYDKLAEFVIIGPDQAQYDLPIPTMDQELDVDQLESDLTEVGLRVIRFD